MDVLQDVADHDSRSWKSVKEKATSYARTESPNICQENLHVKTLGRLYANKNARLYVILIQKISLYPYIPECCKHQNAFRNICRQNVCQRKGRNTCYKILQHALYVREQVRIHAACARYGNMYVTKNKKRSEYMSG